MAQFIVYAAISYALAFIASRLVKQKRSPFDDTPTTVVGRGSYIPLVFGRHVVGPNFLAAHARTRTSEKVSGGKGLTPSQKQDVYYEASWHCLAVGPGSRLIAIRESGATIMQTNIDPTHFPSGSSFDLGKEGAFEIYWGEAGQPKNTALNDYLGTDSEWSPFFSVYWNKKRLGSSAIWSNLEYEIQVLPFVLGLRGTNPWIRETYTDSTTVINVYGSSTGTNGDAYIDVNEYAFGSLGGAVELTLAGWSGSINGVYQIAGVEIVSVALDVAGNVDGSIFDYRTRIYLKESVTDVAFDVTYDTGTVAGTATVRDQVTYGGVNPAHVIYQLYFGEYPWGLCFDRSNYDMDSLERAGEIFRDEGLGVNFKVENGETLLAAAMRLMKDIGMLQPRNREGKFTFVVVRDDGVDDVDIPEIPKEMIVGNLPQIQVNRAWVPNDRLIYLFQDASRRFKTNPIQIKDDGSAIQTKADGTTLLKLAPSPKEVPITTVTSYLLADATAQRRLQEDLGVESSVTIPANREARSVRPGQRIRVEGLSGVFLNLESVRDTQSSRQELRCIRDLYSIEASSFESADDDTGVPESLPVAPDLIVEPVEVPAALNSSGSVLIGFARVRAHEQINTAVVWISTDGTTFEQLGEVPETFVGGELVTPINISDRSLLDFEPEFDIYGPDISTVPDYSADDTSWKAGRLTVLIDDEIFFAQKVTAVSVTRYKLVGLRRARYNTRKETHTAGALVKLIEPSRLTTFSDVLFQPTATVFFKVQPVANGQAVSLDEIPAISYVVRGLGVVTQPVPWVREINYHSTWNNSDDVVIGWGYRSNANPGSGAGLQGYGVAHTEAAVASQFFYEILTDAEVVVFTSGLQTSRAATLLNIGLQFLLGGHVDFRIRIWSKSGAFTAETYAEVRLTAE